MDILSVLNIKKGYLFVLLLICISGVLMRSYAVERRALHNDESLQLNGVQCSSLSGIIKHCTSVDFHPPLSYIFQQKFYKISSINTFGRYASVLAGILVVPIVFWSFRKLLDDRISVIISALTAFSYELIWYSRELRCYIFFYLFSVISFGFFIRILKSTTTKPPVLLFIGFIIFNVLSFYSHYNTMFVWPIYGILFFLYELSGSKNREIRWRYFFGMCFSATIILGLASFAIPMILKWKWLFDMQVMRPGILKLWLSLSPMGFGVGWRGWIWLFLLFIGGYRCFKFSRRVFIIIIGWVLIPILMYLYIKGMSAKFVTAMYRYFIFLNIGFIALLALGIEQIALWVGRGREQIINITSIFVLFLTVVMMLPIYHAYYGLTATGRLYNEIGQTLEELSPRCLFMDNYYEMQFMRHYLPKDMSVAFPPIFNNNAEYQKLDVHGFTKRALESDPLLVFYDAGNLSRRSKPDRDSTWLNSYFKHKVDFINKKGLYLYKYNLNLFTMNDMDKRIDRIYYNTINDLSAIKYGMNEPFLAYGPNWYGLTVMGFDNKWKFLRVLGKEGELYVINNKISANNDLTLNIQGAVANQGINVLYDNKIIKSQNLKNIPPVIFDFRSRKKVQQYIPFASLLRQSKGMLNLPIALNLPGNEVKISTGSLKTGVNKLVVKSRKSDGIIVWQ